LPRVAAPSRRHALQFVSEALASAAGLDARAAFEAGLLRGRLAGTGVGEGGAISHARGGGLTRAVGAFARLAPPIDFDALDKRPADLIFMLLGPTQAGGDHLKALARLSRFLKRGGMREKLRAARGMEDLRALFASTQQDAA